MITRDWPATGLRMTDLGNAILVEQDGRRYKARKWRLTDELIAVVDTAVRHGLTANWVEGHPSQPYLEGGDHFEVGSHHITFARRHHEGWVFVLSAQAKPPSIEAVGFSRKYWYFVHCSGKPYRWEHAGGHNVFVAPSDLEAILSKLDNLTIDAVEAARMDPRSRATVLPKIGITSEYELELAFLEHLKGAPRSLEAPEIRVPCDGLIPDVLLDIRGTALVVVELKFSRASRAELDQLHGYLQLPTMVRRAGARPIVGVLVARSFGDEITRAASAPGGRVSLYTFGYEAGLRLQIVAGRAVLEDLDLL